MTLISLDGIKYPLALRWIQAHGFAGLTPWRLIEVDHAQGLRAEFRRETDTDFHKIKDLLPFAVRQDMDDVAGFIIENGVVQDEVIVAHLTWHGKAEVKGYPSIHRYSSLWSWLKDCIDDTAEWCNEEDLEDLNIE